MADLKGKIAKKAESRAYSSCSLARKKGKYKEIDQYKWSYLAYLDAYYRRSPQ